MITLRRLPGRILGRPGAAIVYVRMRIEHYEPLGMALGYTVASGPIALYASPWIILPTLLAGFGFMTWVARGYPRHDPEMCTRCRELAPYLAGRLASLEDPERMRHRLRIQHQQYVWTLIAFGAVTAVMIPALLFTSDKTSQTVMPCLFGLAIVLEWHMNAWLINHRHYEKLCPWCIRRKWFRVAREEYRNVRRQIDTLLTKQNPPEQTGAEPASVVAS